MRQWFTILWLGSPVSTWFCRCSRTVLYSSSRHAGVYFYGLQIAARLARESDEKPSQSVRETCEDSDGYTLAPEKSICEPPADCVNCRRRNFCPDFGLWESDVEELEERLEAEREANESETEEQNETEEQAQEEEQQDDE